MDFSKDSLWVPFLSLWLTQEPSCKICSLIHFGGLCRDPFDFSVAVVSRFSVKRFKTISVGFAKTTPGNDLPEKSANNAARNVNLGMKV